MPARCPSATSGLGGAAAALLRRSISPSSSSQRCGIAVKQYWNGHRSISTATCHRIPSQSTSLSAPKTSHNAMRPSRDSNLYRLPTTRQFSQSTCRAAYKTVEEARSRHRSGPFSWKAGVLFTVSGVGLVVYFRYEKDRLERKRITDATKGIGKPKVGGEFNLVDHNGRPFTDKDMKGKYALVYFGFTHCPDICPEELDKMAEMMDSVKEKCSGNVLRPIFITCDPARDTPAVVKSYLREFHPDILGLTGTWENVKAVCKAYRVYFSTPPDVKPGQDYLVDHSIYFYLMDPEGDFVEAIGRNFTAEQAAKVIADHIQDWRGPLDKN